MEEQILKILKNNINSVPLGESNVIGVNSASKEIADTYERFDYWKAYNTVRHKGKFNNLKDQFEVVVANKIVWINSLSDLFTYWNTNINK